MRKNEVGMGHCSLFVALKRLSTFRWAEVSLALSVSAVVKDSKPVSMYVYASQILYIFKGEWMMECAADVIRPVVQGRSLTWLLHGLYSAGGMSLAMFPWTW